MTGRLHIITQAAKLIEQSTPFVLITVIKTQGSTPRDIGARMILIHDDLPTGTIGGGELERLAIDAARIHLHNKTSGTEEVILGAHADQCCGGAVLVSCEYIGPRHKLVVFGAGHVAHELANLLAEAPFEIAIVDDRPDWNTPERFAHCQRVLDYDQGLTCALTEPQNTLVCVMCYSHDRDFELLIKLLESPPAFLGLIGSKSKRTSFFTRLSAQGMDEKTIQRIACPVGIGDVGKEPSLVAISIAAQILLEAKKLR